MKMISITSACSKLISVLVHPLGASSSSPMQHPHDTQPNPTLSPLPPVDDLMFRALTAVFGMESNGKIKKDKARQVVTKLGLVQEDEGEDIISGGFDLPGGGLLEDEVPVEEAIGGLEEDRNELLLEAFRIFDEDGNGFIDAVELKRVLKCLGLLDNGWDMGEIEKMLKVVDLNLDGKVDFSEFQVMMR